MAAEEKIAEAKKALEGDDVDSIKRITEELEKLSHAAAESIYKKTAAEAGADASGAGTAGGEAGEGQSKPADENVVEAEYEEVKDKKNE